MNNPEYRITLIEQRNLIKDLNSLNLPTWCIKIPENTIISFYGSDVIDYIPHQPFKYYERPETLSLLLEFSFQWIRWIYMLDKCLEKVFNEGNQIYPYFQDILNEEEGFIVANIKNQKIKLLFNDGPIPTSSFIMEDSILQRESLVSVELKFSLPNFLWLIAPNRLAFDAIDPNVEL